ncbi:MAG TPA: carbohydrate-binding protein [Phycisphaerae bacterium]|nr:carbohydrate-binding protein [Phycisphaerae bacterium]
MATLTRTSPARRRQLGVENLESRLNLSTLSTLVTPAIPQTTGLTTTSVTNSLASNSRLISVSGIVSGSAQDPYKNLKFGDTSVASSGTTSVDVTGYSAISNASVNWGSPTNVGNMAASGVNVSYKLNTAASGTYRLEFDVSAVRWGSFDLYVNGAKQTQYTFLGTGNWNSYTGTVQNVSLAAGANTITITPTWGSQFNISGIKVSPTGAPATTTTTTTTTTSNNTTSTNTAGTLGSSITLSPTQNSGIYNAIVENKTGTPNVGGMGSNGAWVSYTFNVTTAGSYNLSANVAAQSWAAMGVSVNGGTASEIDINSTGGYNSYKPVTGSVYLSAGTVTLKFSNLYGTLFNLGAVTLSSGSSNTSSNNNSTTTTTTTNNNSSTNAGTLGSSLTVTADKYSAISGAYLESQGGMSDIGGMAASGASVTYTLNVTTAGTYTLTAQTALPSWAAMGVSVNGGSVREVDMNNTGSWSNFKPVSTSLNLPAGTVTLKFTNLYATTFNLGTFTLASGGSNTSTTTTTTNNNPPQSADSWSSGGVSVSTAWMTSFNQLNITGTSGNDSIEVSQSGNTIYVKANGQTNAYTGPFGTIMVKGGDGNDTIQIDSSVNIAALIYGGNGSNILKNFTTGKATIVSIGNGYDSVQGNGANTSYWVDPGDSVNASTTEWNAGDVHQVASFWGGVSTSLSGQNLSDPSATGSTTRLTSSSFWGTGPQITDVTQGLVSDCYVVGALQTLANSSPARLQNMAVDLGDGTYAIQFKQNGVTQYVRVDGDLPAGGPYASGLEYAHPGPSGNQWVEIFEKAYAEIGTGGWSYSSLNEGWFGNVFANLGVTATSIGVNNAGSLYNSITSALWSGKGVTLGTNASVWGVPIIGDHTYTVTSANTDQWGTQYITLRNPWGYDGAGSDSNPYDGYVTVAVSQLTPFLMAGTIS